MVMFLEAKKLIISEVLIFNFRDSCPSLIIVDQIGRKYRADEGYLEMGVSAKKNAETPKFAEIL
jgi:stage III sporulation protein SpoIIIAA